MEVLQHSLPYIIIFSDNENIFEIKSHNFFLQDQVQELKILTKSVIRRFRHMKFVYVFAILAVFGVPQCTLRLIHNQIYHQSQEPH